MLSKNIELYSKSKISTWRKTAIGTWRATSDCTVYGLQKVEISPMLEYIKSLEKESDTKVTLAQVMGKICGLTLEKYPEINSIIRFGNIYQRKETNIFFHVASDKEGKDLSGMTVKDANLKSIVEIGQELSTQAKNIKSGNDETFQKTKKSITLVPGFLMGVLLDFLGFFMYSLNLWSPLIGTPRDCFGSMMITNVGSLGIKQAFVPLVNYSRIPLILALGKSFEDAYSENGVVKSGQFINLNWTFDHRLIDGVMAAKMSNYIETILKDPAKYLD